MGKSIKDLFKGERPILFNNVKLSKELCILVLAPHPDDFDQVGITMRFFRDNGNQIYVAVVSGSESGVEDGFCPGASQKKKVEIREEEQKNSCEFFKLPESHLEFLHLIENEKGHPLQNRENLELVKNCLLDKQPDIVFLPHSNDPNRGHQLTYSILTEAITQLNYSVAVLLNRDPKTISMRHDIYTSFGPEEAKWKGQMLQFHQSQHQRNLNTRAHGVDERILQVNRQIAQELGIKQMYAEAFELEWFGALAEKN